MNVIDLEILIPASPEFIWRFLGDLAALPQWQEHVSSVMFLSTQRQGNGVRWRALSDNGSDTVVAISAWYDTVGYEYSLVDGTRFAENQGRIRLTEVTDGTLVRWTFQYEHKGMLGGLRNTVRLKRATTNQIQASLRNLHQLIARESGGISTHEAKASVREAPDVGERSAYTPRHPSAFHEPSARDETQVISAGDTDKKPAVFDFSAFANLPPVEEESDTKPNPVALAPDFEPSQPAATLYDTKPVLIDDLPAEPPPPRPPPKSPSERALPPAPRPQPEPRLERQRELRDRSELSVFEIFGLQRPSETGQRADSPLEASPISNPPVAPREEPPQPTERPVPEPTASAQFSAPVAPMPMTIVGLRRRNRRQANMLRSHS